MTPQEFISRAQSVWGTFDGDPDEVFGIWRGALADVRPEQLQAAFNYLVKASRFKPKPADVFSAIEKLGMTPRKHDDDKGVKFGVMLDFANTRRWELMDDWKRRNFALWKEAERDGWDGVWLTEARKRAHELAQVEYVAKHHGWPKETVALFEITSEEIAGHNEFQLHFTDAQISFMRKMGAMVSQKIGRVHGFKSVATASEELLRGLT